MNELGNGKTDKDYKPSGISRAEERAQAYENGLDYYHYTGDNPSVAYKAGYEQAEKDLQWEVNHTEEAYQNGYVAGLKERLTWHEIKSIVNIADELTMEIENMREGITKPFMQSEESFFKEVMKRYGDGK